jgi:uncharacterized protein YkwD
MAKIERFVHREVNDRRRSSGEGDLRGHPHLIESAQTHARDMARQGFYGHTNPDGESVADRVPGGAVSENIAKIYDDGHHPYGIGAKAVKQWAESSGHRRNILDSSYRWSGVGAWPGDGWVYVVQAYAEPCGELGGGGQGRVLRQLLPI